MIYPALGVRTDFSLGESVVTVDDLPNIAAELGTDVVGVADTMSVSALIPATKALAKVDKRLMIGARIRVIEEATKEAKPTYIKLWAIDEKGMQSLYRLISRGFEEDRFYYVARVTWDDIETICDTEHLALTTGDLESALQRDESTQGLTTLLKRKRFAAVFAELIPSKTPYYVRQNHRAVAWAHTHGHETIVIQPILWRADNADVFSENASIIEKRPYKDYLQPASEYDPKRPVDLAALAVQCSEAIEQRYGAGTYSYKLSFKEGFNASRLVDLCTYSWVKQPPALPDLASDPNAALTAACKDGWAERFKVHIFAHKPSPDELRDEYLPRLKFELDTLKRLGFAQYFLLVAKLVRWSKDQGILVGPGRGSVGGSLVAYLMGITDVDPIRFKLLFERFINPDRLDLPDADLDFMSTRREEVIAHLEKTYGADKVAGIANYNTLGAKSAVRDIGKIHGLGMGDVDPIRLVPDVHGQPMNLVDAAEAVPEIQAFAEKYPEVWAKSCKMEGKLRAFGKHAAGVVVANIPLTDRAVVERRSGNRCINWDKSISEDQGLIKLDVLGLSTLDTFAHALKLIRERHGKTLDLNALPLDDPKTLRLFSEAKTAGIFQFEGHSVRKLLKQMSQGGDLTFDDLVALNALNRPGPLDAGLVEQYINRRDGTDPVVYDDPVLEPVLKDTFGVIAYQEQVMQVARTLCGFTPGEADVLRKAMGKKIPEEMAKQRNKFIDGAVATTGFDARKASILYDAIEKFAGYAFNRSHAVEYTLISFQAAYLKAHYLVEFYAAALTTAKEDKLAAIVASAALDQISVMPPDINISTGSFEVMTDTSITAPLSAVKNVSMNGAAAVVQARKSVVTGKVGKTTVQLGPGPFQSIDDLRQRVPPRLLNSRAIDHLDKVGAFARIEPGQLHALDVSRRRDQVELMPGVLDQGVMADRDVDTSVDVDAALNHIYDDMVSKLGNATCLPHLGKDARFMVIFDAPMTDQELITDSFSFIKNVKPSLSDAGLHIDHGYWTFVAKRPKSKDEKSIPAAEIAMSVPYLMEEIRITKPPVIILLGTQAIKALIPDAKKPSDLIGTKKFNSTLDATLIIGFNPGQIYHDPSKAEILRRIFEEAKSLIDINACAA